MSDTCYWCGSPATSKEHVPPKCLFPENKDTFNIFNKSLRENLITVPSCDIHNLQKSNDDEFLMTLLAGKVGNNFTAYIHNNTKVSRSMQRNPNIISPLLYDVINLNNSSFPISIIQVDNLRLLNSFESIARGLYYHVNSTHFTGKLTILSKLFSTSLISPNKEIYTNWISAFEKELLFGKLQKKVIILKFLDINSVKKMI